MTDTDLVYVDPFEGCLSEAKQAILDYRAGKKVPLFTDKSVKGVVIEYDRSDASYRIMGEVTDECSWVSDLQLYRTPPKTITKALTDKDAKDRPWVMAWDDDEYLTFGELRAVDDERFRSDPNYIMDYHVYHKNPEGMFYLGIFDGGCRLATDEEINKYGWEK